MPNRAHEGLAEARNTAIARAHGEWIAPLDSDDLMLPTYLEKAMLLATRRSEVNHITPDLELFGAESSRASYSLFVRERHLFENQVPYCSLFKRVLWERAGGYLPIIPFGAEDWNFTVTCSSWLVPERLSEALVRYRRHLGGSMVSGVEAHQAEVNACLHTIHPAKYDPAVLMVHHERLGEMALETRESIDRVIARFPHFSTPYLWRGMHRRRQGQRLHAIRDFKMAASLAAVSDWQPWFCLTVIHAESGDPLAAAAAAEETLRRCPHHPFKAVLADLAKRALSAPQERSGLTSMS